MKKKTIREEFTIHCACENYKVNFLDFVVDAYMCSAVAIIRINNSHYYLVFTYNDINGQRFGVCVRGVWLL